MAMEQKEDVLNESGEIEGVPIDDDGLAELRELAMDHPGRRALVRSIQWRTVVTILKSNHEELVEHLDAPNHREDLSFDLIRDLGRRKDQPDYITEVYRLLHNYLASVMTLVDHSRNLMAEYPAQSDVRRMYQERVDRIKDDPLAKFVQDLRHVVLHAELPSVISSVTWTRGSDGPRHEMMLDREALLKKATWKAPARTFLRDQPEVFAIREPIDAYLAEAMNLSAWIGAQFELLHREEMSAYEQLLDGFLAGEGAGADASGS